MPPAHTQTSRVRSASIPGKISETRKGRTLLCGHPQGALMWWGWWGTSPLVPNKDQCGYRNRMPVDGHSWGGGGSRKTGMGILPLY